MEKLWEIKVNIHTQLINTPLKQDYNVTSHTTHVVCANFSLKYQNVQLQYKGDFERQIFKKIFMAILFSFQREKA